MGSPHGPDRVVSYNLDYQPASYSDAVLYAYQWYHDSGFSAYLRGYCAGVGIAEPPRRGNRLQLVRWAREQLAKEQVEMAPVIVQLWEESERGWGVRPDGYSLHLTEADRVLFVSTQRASLPDAVPDEYSRPIGMPYASVVDAETRAAVTVSDCGTRHSGTAPENIITQLSKNP